MVRSINQNSKTEKALKRSRCLYGDLVSVSLLLVSLMFASCVEGPKNSTAKNEIPPSLTDSQSGTPTTTVNSPSILITGSPSSQALQGTPYTFTPDSIESGVIVTGVNLPSWMSLNTSTGVITGFPTEAAVYNNMSLIATKGGTYTQIGPFSLSVTGDPLFNYQWHLLNTGQSNFATNGGTSGFDLNLGEAYNGRVTGVGVSVAVSDSGMDLTHEDLDDNLFDLHKNYFLDSPFIGSPQPRSREGDHGTSVAGIIAAEGWNNIGIRGVAPGASVAGFRYIGSLGDAERVLDQASGPYYLFNYSYGYGFTNYNFSFDFDYQDQLLQGYISGRLGAGQVYVKSAGNSYRECDFYSSSYYLIEDVGICFSHNANVDTDNVTIPMIVVGAMNANGQKSSYSSVGSSLWVSAFGGEYGSTDPAILTIDQRGCANGYSRTAASGTDFMKGLDPLNSDCDYTHTFNGTSSAAPMVSGIVALMMEANPSLTARDIKHILAVTATKVSDPSFSSAPPHENSEFFELAGHTYEQGFVTNAAGYSFHNWFGFGLVNGDAAVAMAKTYTSTWGSLNVLNSDFSNSIYKTTVNGSIPDASATGRSSSIFVNNSLTIEHVQIMINVLHGRPGDLGVELTSPSGTKSILLNINNSFLIPNDSGGSPVWVADLTDMVLASNAFYGESSRGLWTVKVIDGLGGNTGTEYDDASSQTGTLVDWAINISGH